MPTKKAPKTAEITARVYRRVTAATPTPYLARVMNMRGEPTQIVVMVTEVVPAIELSKTTVPAWGRATVMTNLKGSIFYRRGEVLRVDNFGCLRRLELTAIA